MALDTKILVRVRATLTGVGDQGTPQVPIELLQSLALLTGTAASKADLIFSDQRTLAASATENLDLAGVLTDLLGNVLTFVKVKWIFAKAAAGNTNSVIIGNGTNPFVGGFGAGTHTWTIPPGGFIFAAAPVSGWTVTAATADILKIANSGAGTSVTYDINIGGTSV